MIINTKVSLSKNGDLKSFKIEKQSISIFLQISRNQSNFWYDYTENQKNEMEEKHQAINYKKLIHRHEGITDFYFFYLQKLLRIKNRILNTYLYP